MVLFFCLNETFVLNTSIKNGSVKQTVYVNLEIDLKNDN